MPKAKKDGQHIGPQIGAPPSLEQVAVGRLQVDSSYQRLTDGPASARIIAGMLAGWNWALCQPLVAARREDGGLWILDGQHRHAAALRRDDIHYLPCVILPPIGTEAEAHTFVSLNTARQKLSQADIFTGMLAAGDESARAVARLMEETGWRLVRHTSTNTWKVGDIHCAPMLVTALKLRGEEVLRAALAVLRIAWPKTVVTCAARLLEALFRMPETLLDPQQHVRLSRALSSRPPAAWLTWAERERGDNPALTRHDSLKLAIMRVFSSLAPQASAPKTGQAPALVAGIGHGLKSAMNSKVWCSQCETNVDCVAANNCRSSFCKAKEAA